jgi:probable rRNA maturation factor
MPKEIEIEVQIAPAFAGQVTADSLRATAETVLRHEATPGQATLVLTDDKGIRALNRDFLGRDAPTDVLAFSAQEDADPATDAPGSAFVAAPEMGGYLGDVIVSYPRAVAQAEAYGHSLEEELHLLIVHGMLHLLGYDHASEQEKAVMWARQAAILDAL